MDKIDFAVGDIITTWHKGYWRLVEIQRRYLTEDYIDRFGGAYAGKKVGDEYSPMLVYEQVMMENFKMVTKKTRKECDAKHCEKITKEKIDKLQADFNSGCAQLKSLIVNENAPNS